MRVVPLAFILCALMAPAAFAWCDLGVDDGIESARLGCSDSSCSTWCDSIFDHSSLATKAGWGLSVDCECQSSNCSCRVECDNDQGVTVVDTVTGIGRAAVRNCSRRVDCRLQLGRQASGDRATCNVASYSNKDALVFPIWVGIVIVVIIIVCCTGCIACCYCCCCRRPNSVAAQEDPGTQMTVVSATNTTMMHSPSYPYPPQGQEDKMQSPIYAYPPQSDYPPQQGQEYQPQQGYPLRQGYPPQQGSGVFQPPAEPQPGYVQPTEGKQVV
jgi:hypothetical protein